MEKEKGEMERKEEEEITAAIQCFVAMQQNCTRVAREFPFTVNEEEKEEEKEAKEVEEEKEEKEEEEEEEEEDEGVEITAIMQSSQQCRGIVHVCQGNCQVNKDKEKKRGAGEGGQQEEWEGDYNFRTCCTGGQGNCLFPSRKREGGGG